MDIQITGCLGERYTTISDYSNSFDFKLAAEPSLFHLSLQFDEHPFLGVRQTGSSSMLLIENGADPWTLESDSKDAMDYGKARIGHRSLPGWKRTSQAQGDMKVDYYRQSLTPGWLANLRPCAQTGIEQSKFCFFVPESRSYAVIPDNFA